MSTTRAFASKRHVGLLGYMAGVFASAVPFAADAATVNLSLIHI